MLLTRMAPLKRAQQDRPKLRNEQEKMGKVRKSMARIKLVLGERRSAYKEARRRDALGI